MLTVILGAGASCDSVDLGLDSWVASDTRYRPPLAKELFGDRVNFGTAFDELPDLAALVNPLRAVGRGDELETKLQEFEDEAASYPFRHRQLLALRCYLQRILDECGTHWHQRAHGITHYAELVDHIERWRSNAGETVCLRKLQLRHDA
jgi:hypothetical protein